MLSLEIMCHTTKMTRTALVPMVGLEDFCKEMMAHVAFLPLVVTFSLPELLIPPVDQGHLYFQR